MTVRTTTLLNAVGNNKHTSTLLIGIDVEYAHVHIVT